MMSFHRIIPSSVTMLRLDLLHTLTDTEKFTKRVTKRWLQISHCEISIYI